MSRDEGGTRLRDDSRAIWQAGLEAVDSERLVAACVRAKPQAIEICGHEFPIGKTSRILAVGAGKAGAGMAAGLETALAGTPLAERLSGWVNVPADCVRQLARIHLHAARPSGLNEPTAAGVAGAEEILRRVRQLSDLDLCLVLLSGGGSALLPAPAPGITLADKLAVTRLLMAGGATINELNCVRKHLSAIKGGNLARAAGNTRVVSLIISDVVGDPLDVIGSGPTVADESTVSDALSILQRVASRPGDVPETVWSLLESKRNGPADPPLPSTVWNFVIGNNETALSAAQRKAAELGYATRSLGSRNQGEAREVGRTLAELIRALRDSEALTLPSPARLSSTLRLRPEGSSPKSVGMGEGSVTVGLCVLAGGETTVRLAATIEARRGGRNQELVLGAVDALWDDGMERLAVLSGGTDGEDGPTDAAGAVADAQLIRRARQLGLAPGPFLAINNSYEFFERTGGLIKTGPTHTNVMDVWLALISQPQG